MTFVIGIVEQEWYVALHTGFISCRNLVHRKKDLGLNQLESHFENSLKSYLPTLYLSDIMSATPRAKEAGQTRKEGNNQQVKDTQKTSSLFTTPLDLRRN